MEGYSVSPVPDRTWVRGSCVGKGSFGTVSLAVDKLRGEVFAVKSVCLSPISSSSSVSIHSLENEIRILQSLSSPYVVSYLGDDFTRESPTHMSRNLHMEYIPGGTVAELAAGYGRKGLRVEECDVQSYTRCLVLALRYLHSVGVVHCDVKGRNVLLDPASGQAKLADFGSAKRINGGGGTGTEEAADCPRGTPLWMAPDVVRGEGQSPESDVWSLGCTVIEMVTGGPPWQNRAHEEAGHTLLRIGFGNEVPEFPPELSNAGRDFLDKCLRRNRSERWTCDELLGHPFLTESTSREPSPRSVLDWVSAEFQADDDDGEVEEEARDYKQNSINASSILDARERVRELASSREVGWVDEEEEGDNNGWEVVRSGYETPHPMQEREEDARGGEGEEGISRGYLNCGDREEWGGCDGDVREASGRGGGGGGGMSHVASCCSDSSRSRYCCRDGDGGGGCGCEVGFGPFGCQHGFLINCGVAGLDTANSSMKGKGGLFCSRESYYTDFFLLPVLVLYCCCYYLNYL